MAVPFNSNPPEAGCFREAVCIDTRRIYDSCSDKDCISDAHVYFCDAEQAVIDQAVSVKAKKAEIIHVMLDVEPVPFNQGFYSVDITYFFLISLSAYTSAACQPIPVCGYATFTKKVILYGSEGNVKTFSSDGAQPCGHCQLNSNLPKASVQVVDPLVLACRLVESPVCVPEVCPVPPSCVSCLFEGNFENVVPVKQVIVTLGLFSIVQLERSVQMMIPAYDFCVPDKECTGQPACEDPCELFSRLKFPTEQFFPPRMSDLTDH